MPRRRSKPPQPDFKTLENAAEYYFSKISELFKHNPQLIFEMLENWYVCAAFVKEHFADADLEKKLNEMLQKNGQ